MFKITVINDGIVKSVQYNRDAAQGEANARMQFGDSCEYIVENTDDAE